MYAEPAATERGVFAGDGPTVAARSDAVVVTFVIDPDAPITRHWTVGR